jgi:hypothetical protein
VGALDKLIAEGPRPVWKPDEETFAKIRQARAAGIEFADIAEAVSAEAGFFVSGSVVRGRYVRWLEQG